MRTDQLGECGRRDSNPHSEELVPKTSASANFATPASVPTLGVKGGRFESRRVDWSNDYISNVRRIWRERSQSTLIARTNRLSRLSSGPRDGQQDLCGVTSPRSGRS